MNTAPIRKISKRRSVAFLIFASLVFFIIPFYLILTGVWSLTDCPASVRLPLWMIFFGIIVIIERVLFWKRLLNEMKFEKTFPRPSFGSTERIRTWEKNRTSSTSKTVLYLITTLRNVIFLAVLMGFIFSFDFIYYPNKAGECSQLVSWSVFIVSSFAILLWSFAIIGTLYVHFANSLASFENTAVASLNRVFREDQ